jgi:NAD(P)-dependent dehydrogenase (short-subunit alcohol dehydrogenase family)
MGQFPERTVALVTGAAGAIGLATCAALIKAGVQVVGSDLAPAPKDLAVQAWLELDVTSEADWRKTVDRIADQFGRLDCLVNNAGICRIQSISDTSAEIWRKTLAVNAESVLIGMKACLPLLRRSGEARRGGASIVNVASAAGLIGVPFVAAYCASKGAVTLLTKAAAKEFAALGYPIRVNSLHPSTVESPMTEENFAQFVKAGWGETPEVARAKELEKIPLRRLAAPEEVAAGVVFLCSSESSYMNGAELVIDGGVTA